MKPPSFEPWLARVRMARAWAAALGFALVAMLGYQGGMAPDDAVLRGLTASIVCFFVGWASSLWICGELYNAQVQRVRNALQEREFERERRLQAMYDRQMGILADNEPGVLTASQPPITTAPIGAPPRREAA